MQCGNSKTNGNGKGLEKEVKFTGEDSRLLTAGPLCLAG